MTKTEAHLLAALVLSTAPELDVLVSNYESSWMVLVQRINDTGRYPSRFVLSNPEDWSRMVIEKRRHGVYLP